MRRSDYHVKEEGTMQLLLEQMNGYVLVAVLVLCILVLSKATDILVDEAISLSLEWGMS